MPLLRFSFRLNEEKKYLFAFSQRNSACAKENRLMRRWKRFILEEERLVLTSQPKLILIAEV
jgi:hypothetical protein